MNYKFLKLLGLFILMGFLGTAYSKSSDKAQDLFIFAGSASRPPLEEVVKLFQKKTGIKVYVTYGGSGYVLSQMILSKRGDIYFPGSSDYMEKAKREGYVYPETEKKVVYLVPAINVQRGNPKNIKSLKDLLRPGLKVAIANPEVVCVGIYAVEILEKNLTPEERTIFRRNLVTYTESCSKTATAVSLKTVDAVIGWRIFEHWDPERIEAIPFDSSEITRIGYIPIAISKFTKNRELAQEFINFILSQEAKDIFKRHHYFMSSQEAFTWIGEKKPIGGEYKVSSGWFKK